MKWTAYRIKISDAIMYPVLLIFIRKEVVSGTGILYTSKKLFLLITNLLTV